MKRIRGLVARMGSLRAESIIETLSAVLICALAILMLYTAVASAARMNASAEERTDAMRHDMLAVETQSAGGQLREVAIDGLEGSYTVEYFEGESGLYCSYRLA